MTLSNTLLQDLDALIQSKHLLQHPFYKAWSKGELSLDCLKDYAKEYYHHVQAFPTYISALHSHTENPLTRQVLLKNLIEEEAGSPNHPDLWKNFALSLGVTQEELVAHTPNSEIKSLITLFRRVCSQASVAEGIAALYAYESQIPEICISKIAGLKTHYGMNHPQDWEYFKVHIAADTEHAKEERELLKSYVSPNNEKEILTAARQILDALWNFLSGRVTRHQ
ncbi:MAG: Coenzyme synthesis protein family protein, partial [Chlamydiia bacterium]|nr:Coenzyme synthesis protein family protein [Chlamydiia bacterium]